MQKPIFNKTYNLRRICEYNSGIMFMLPIFVVTLCYRFYAYELWTKLKSLEDNIFLKVTISVGPPFFMENMQKTVLNFKLALDSSRQTHSSVLLILVYKTADTYWAVFLF